MDPTGSSSTLTKNDYDQIAAGASWMISNCEVACVYGGPPGCLLFSQVASPKPSSKALRDVSNQFVKRLRRFAGHCPQDATNFFKMQLALITNVISRGGSEAGVQAADTLLQAEGVVPPTGKELERLESGCYQALCSHLRSAASTKNATHLEAALTLLKSSYGRILTGSHAKKLHVELSSKFSECIVRGASGPFDAAMRTLLFALQPLGNVDAEKEKQKRQPRAWGARLAQEARRRLKRSKILARKPSALAPTEWLEKRPAKMARAPMVKLRLANGKRARASENPITVAELPTASAIKRRRADASPSNGIIQHPQGSSAAASKAVPSAVGECDAMKGAISGETRRPALRGLKRSSACVDLGSAAEKDSRNDICSTSAARARPSETLQVASSLVGLAGSQGSLTKVLEAPAPSLVVGRQWQLRKVVKFAM